MAIADELRKLVISKGGDGSKVDTIEDGVRALNALEGDPGNESSDPDPDPGNESSDPDPDPGNESSDPDPDPGNG